MRRHESYAYVCTYLSLCKIVYVSMYDNFLRRVSIASSVYVLELNNKLALSCNHFTQRTVYLIQSSL